MSAHLSDSLDSSIQDEDSLAPLAFLPEVARPVSESTAIDKVEDFNQLVDRLVSGDDIDEPSIPEHPAVRSVASEDVRTRPCVVCSGTAARAVYEIEGVSERLVVCHSCGLGSLHPLPNAARIRAFYPPEYYGTPSAKFTPLVERGVRLAARMWTRRFLHGLGPNPHVLDIGCGRGIMLRGVLDLGGFAHGVEISPEAAAAVDPRADVRIASDLEEAAYETDSMDAVIMWHVLEHMPDPNRTLSEIRRILKPGGRLGLAVPNFASLQSQLSGEHWFHLDLPRHIYHFGPRSLSALLRQHGFLVPQNSARHLGLLQNSFGWLQSLSNRFSGNRNELYSRLHRGNREDCGAGSTLSRVVCRAAVTLGLPFAASLSLAESLMNRSGTIALVAENSATPPQVAQQSLELTGAC